MYGRDSKTMLAPDGYKALSPLDTAPVITHGDVALAENNAIIDYILDQTDDHDMRPKPGHADRADYLFWFHAAQGSYQPIQTGRYVNSLTVERSLRLVRGIIRKVIDALNDVFYNPRLKIVMGLMQDQLSRYPFAIRFWRERDLPLPISPWAIG